MLTLAYPVARPLLFRLSAETAHEVAATVLRVMHKHSLLRGLLRGGRAPTLPVRALGRTFASPVLVAAGFDKGASMYNALGALGFGGVEVGTITAHAQPGNERPRLFRLAEDRALLNRMGFNNVGAQRAAEAIRAHPPQGVVLGINLGKSKVTPLETAAEDYANSAALLGPLADYLVVNVSSPNTPGLRSLQSVDALRAILVAVRAALSRASAAPPLLVKIAPDLAEEDVDAIADIALETSLDGLIATNTTIAREGLGLRTPQVVLESLGAGGLSGPPVRERALAVLRRLRARLGPRITLVASGGIETVEHAWECVESGATLIQVYTGMIYGGPGIARRLTAGLAQRLHERGLDWEHAVGSGGSSRPALPQERTPEGPRELEREREPAEPHS